MLEMTRLLQWVLTNCPELNFGPSFVTEGSGKRRGLSETLGLLAAPSFSLAAIASN